MNSWFHSAATGDDQGIKKHKNKYQKKTDTRQTNADEKIFQGFSALHYACYYGSILVARELIEEEFNTVTECDVEIDVIGFDEQKMILPAHSTPLQIALLRKKKSIIRLLKQYIEDQAAIMSTTPK